MITFLMSLAIFALYVLSAQGWGKITLHTIGNRDTARSFPYEVALGIASLIFVGGILNVAHIAYSATIYLLVIAGLLFNVYTSLNAFKATGASRFLESLNKPHGSHVSIIITIFVGVFLIVQLLPSSIFNHHDDMHSYLMRISLMLGTGTLGQNPLGLIGLDSLGAQPFMQSFSVSVFGLKYANGFDAVFCFVLSCALVVSLARHVRAHWLVTLSSLLALLLINMQQVNLSSVYSTTALILGLAHACIYLAENTKVTKKINLNFVPILFFCSSLIAMKLLAAVFTSIFFILLFCTLRTNKDESAKSRAVAFLTTGVQLIVFSSPWFIVHADKYINGISKLSKTSAGDADKDIDMASNIENLPFDTFFSNQELFWGGNHLGYNTLFFVTALIFVIFAIAAIRSEGSTRNSVLTALCGATTLSYILGMLIFEYNMALRYSLPFLAASIAISFILLTSANPANKNTVTENPLSWLTLGTITVFQAFMIHSFSHSFDRRIDVAQNYNGTLMFPVTNKYKQYIDSSFSAENKNHYKDIQSLCSEESGILAWVSSPFLFDFDKNRIFTMAGSQTLTPWYDLPIDKGDEAVREYLLALGIQCIIWEHQGAGMKQIKQYESYAKSNSIIYRRLGTQVIKLRQTLTRLANSSKVLHISNGLVVYNLQNPTQTKTN